MQKVHIYTADPACIQRTTNLIDAAFCVEYHEEPNCVSETVGAASCVIVDDALTGEHTEQFLNDLMTGVGPVPVVMVLSNPDIPTVIAYTQHGALDCLPKPVSARSLAQSLTKAFSMSVTEGEDGTQQETTGIVGTDRKTVRLRQTVERVARKGSPVLLYGESGVGKDLVARAIHRRSVRSAKPFVAVNCAAIPETLFESELFGVRRGAYTGALEKDGILTAVAGGTLFLDEIGELPLRQQAKLLRVLEDRSVTPLGGTRSHPVDFRLVSATNRNLFEMVRRKAFRRDLYYRLSTAPIRIYPLRSRMDDLWPLVREFFHRRNEVVPSIYPDARVRLERYEWPGNVRELYNVLERALILSEKGEIRGRDIVFDSI